MNLRVLASSAAVVGGLCWLVRWVVDLTAGDPGWGGVAHWVGLGLLAVAVAVVGAGLVSRSALWLWVIVALAAPLLAWSVYAVVRGDGEGTTLDGVLGIVALLAGAAGLVRGRGERESEAPRQRPGRRAAR
ncbi:hypothetical protein [Nocardioides coralli]|uniref:hypothetical protein n=1 Tax=Nocardioides coralli TaxID=2872154 RepID=UPI001CA3D693|nr:hypothetical protein [Nocardioides coralli]QZY28744.1 hypothetical protein K6T13_14985 [Nocardioides coralli]